MDRDLISGIRQALQDVVAPEVRERRGHISALDTRIEALEKVQQARFSEVNAKFDTLLNVHSLELRNARLEPKPA